jgi:thiosulfate dehydrogenase
MKVFRTPWFPVLLGIIFSIGILSKMLFPAKQPLKIVSSTDKTQWHAPDINLVPENSEGDMIRYGYNLIANTSKYFGPHGIVSPITNGMNCQNCHLEAGTRSFGNSFSAVASAYPRFRERSGRVESIEFRINDCMQRSLNGKGIDSLSREMRAMVAFFKWLGEGVKKGEKPYGSGIVSLPFLDRAADPQKGIIIYKDKCQRCHGRNGEGVMYYDSMSYKYPPLWGENSFNIGAGLYRISRLAAFVKYNMPFDQTLIKPELTDEEAWDVAAFICSQPRPEKVFPEDWPRIEAKPVDHPFGPYADNFSEHQHKYGPFIPIVEAKEKKQASLK